MKPQDILFIIVLLFLLWRRSPRYLVVAALVCLTASMPLFHFWVFFTAERFVDYAVGFLFIAICIFIYKGVRE